MDRSYSLFGGFHPFVRCIPRGMPVCVPWMRVSISSVGVCSQGGGFCSFRRRFSSGDGPFVFPGWALRYFGRRFFSGGDLFGCPG